MSTLMLALAERPEGSLRFQFADGDLVPGHCHVTEVAYWAKTAVDCGGTVRSEGVWVLQLWASADDPDHRLTTGKLAAILQRSRPALSAADGPVEIEYEGCFLSQYPVEGVEEGGGALTLRLIEKHTDCRAREACGLAPASGCCGGGGEALGP